MSDLEIRLIALDVDDTLIRKDLSVPESVAIAIGRAQSAGAVVTLATGRMFASIEPYARRLGFTAPLIAYNGGLVQDLSGRVFSHNPVPKREVVELAEMTQGSGLCLNLYVDDKLYVAEENDAVRYYTSIARLEAHCVGDLVAFSRRIPDHSGSTKVLIVAPPEEVDAWLPKLQSRFADRLEITRSKPSFVEITAPGVTKGRALKAVADHLGIPQRAVMAVGDSFNDVAMLEYAGIGVAVKNAPEAVKQVADCVVATNEEGGVAEAIERYVLATVGPHRRLMQ